MPLNDAYPTAEQKSQALMILFRKIDDFYMLFPNKQ